MIIKYEGVSCTKSSCYFKHLLENAKIAFPKPPLPHPRLHYQI